MKKILSIAFSLMILLSSVGLAKTIHLCMGTETESAIGFSTSHIECEMAKKKPSCHSEKESSKHEEKDCCDEKFELLVLDQDLQKSSLNLDYSPEFVLSLVYTFFGVSVFPTEKNENYNDYPPPVLRQDLQVLHQSFLI
ncbi:HYC_CC_PP family protein [Algoriphagus yeomjeoni]|uniref:HYC_CC_PP family protein n=1 Tax=Algoriphagus yeomjeoni TaxID=291403 RepID=UPI003CE5B946